MTRTDGRSRRWQDHQQDRRQRVIQAAIEVLEEAWPHTEIKVQRIADRAGINRSVLYRYFADRTDLDVAVQESICARLSEVVVPAIRLEGRPREIVQRIVGAGVGWAADHPALIRFAERDIPGAAARPFEATLELFAAQFEDVIARVAEILGADLTPDDRASLDPWMFSVIAGALAGVQRWSGRPQREPARERFALLASDIVWHQVAGLAADRGIDLPDVPIDDVIRTLKPAPVIGVSPLQ